MKPSEELLFRLRTLLLAYPKLTYDDGSSDSSGEAVSVVKLPWFRLLRWKGERNQQAEQRLRSWVDMRKGEPGVAKLASLLLEHDLVSYVRNTNRDEQADLYLLVPYGWWSIGIKTTLIQT